MMIDCSKCRYFYGYDGVGELWTGCSIHGDFKGKKTHCNHFEKKVTKSDLLNKIQSLEKENEQLKETIEKLRWDLDTTREDLNYFANLKVMAMKGYEPMEDDGDGV